MIDPNDPAFARVLQQMIEREVAPLRARLQAQGVISGAGDPEGVVVAPVGAIFRRLDGGASTTLYVKESGIDNTGWVAK